MHVQNTVRTICALCVDSAVMVCCVQEEEGSVVYSVGMCDAFHEFWHCDSVRALLLCTTNFS